MVGELIISVGLFIDAIGALGVVVPDLPDKYRVVIHRITPKIRLMDQSVRRLEQIQRSDVSDQPERLIEIFRPIWETIRWDKSHYEDIRFENVDDVLLTNTGNYRVISSGTDIGGLGHFHQTDGIVDRYIQSRYRIGGFVMLSAGFFIQMVGTLI